MRVLPTRRGVVSGIAASGALLSSPTSDACDLSSVDMNPKLGIGLALTVAGGAIARSGTVPGLVIGLGVAVVGIGVALSSVNMSASDALQCIQDAAR